MGLNSSDSLCAYCGAGSSDAVFYLALSVDSGVDISTVGSNFDTVLFIMETGPNGTGSPGSIRLCNDDCYTGNGTSHIQTSLPAGLYYVYLDGAGGACGDFQLNVIVSPAATCPNLGCDYPNENCETCPFDCPCVNCPDGSVDTDEGEECDDNNPTDGDGCSSECVVESGYTCTGEPSSCVLGFTLDERAVCSCTIPDGGIRIDTMSVLDTCTIAAINIDMDITHFYRGDIELNLQSPLGTNVRLKVENGADSGDHIVGNYEATLTVDGPGALADYVGQQAFGVWILTVEDHWAADQGTLNSWSIHLTCQ